MVTKPLPDIK